MSIKKTIVNRLIWIYLLVFAGALVVILRILQLQLIQGEELRQMATDLTMKYESIEPYRGDIYASDGRRLLATSVPYYEIRMDLKSTALDASIFRRDIDSLSLCLSSMFRDKSPSEYKRLLTAARGNNKRFYLIRRRVSYQQLQEMKKFPIFRMGRYKGGFIVIQKNRRIRPHNLLAARTIGYVSSTETGTVVGIEGAYDHLLKGVTGIRLMQKTAGSIWIPVSDANEVEPQNGYDVVTTIDIDIQDVAENALLKQLEQHNAHHGCVVLMEVSTGNIKAIANLQLDEDGSYNEIYNYAIAESTEPGSTFKLASLMAAMEDGFVSPGDTIDAGNGTVKFYDKVIRDTRREGYGKITVKEAFEVSSNVAFSKIINSYYKGREEDFVERLYQMHLNEKLGIEIKGEGQPFIQYPGDEYWSGISLPMMSHGYEVRMTPLQILVFYNAVANNGSMVKPKFIDRITHYGQVVKKTDTEIIDASICSRETIRNARLMLEGVVLNGTAKNLVNEHFTIAGKTGTAQIANDKYGYKVDSKVSYQASFVGYFPADYPKYSCIVVINSPSSEVYYGNLVAGPVFREIANKVYATSLDMHHPVYQLENPVTAGVPYSKHGSVKELMVVLDQLGIESRPESPDLEWVLTRKMEDHIAIDRLNVKEGIVPNVKEMGLKDAVYLLEKEGLVVRVMGRGKVLEQSIQPGTIIEPGRQITLTMSII
jgi:cell division protein FtsI (penicillin-binding protein 3)